MKLRNRFLAALLSCAASVAASAQTAPPAAPAASASPAVPAPAATPTPAPNIDVRMIRLKLSAGDLPSAESILEFHRTEKGEDADYTMGVSWVARGAALLGDWNAASAFAAEARRIAAAKLKSPADYDSEREAAYALGTAIEVESQGLAASGKKSDAIRLLEESERAQEKAGAGYNLRARIWKRRNQIELVGQKAPAIHADDHLGEEVPTLESLRGKPVVLFFWWESCGDCQAEAATFHKIVQKYSTKGVAFLAPTRFYGKPEERPDEKAAIEKAWSDTYVLTGTVPVPITDSGMLRYGVSATPTFVLLDRSGIVRLYSPTRMTEKRLSEEIDKLLR